MACRGTLIVRHDDRITTPATRERPRRWLQRFQGQEAALDLEATTGWRFLVEELQAAGLEAHLAEPADTRALRGPKASQDRPRGCPPPPQAVAGRAPAGVLDPTHTHPGVAQSGPSA